MSLDLSFWCLNVFGMSYFSSATTWKVKFLALARRTKCSRVFVLCSEYTTFELSIAFSTKAVSIPAFLVPKGGFITTVSKGMFTFRVRKSILMKSMLVNSNLPRLTHAVSSDSSSTSIPVTVPGGGREELMREWELK